MTDSPEAVMARTINPTCWNYGDLPRVQDEVYLAGARGEANRQAKEMHAALRAAGFAIVPREPTEKMLKAPRGRIPARPMSVAEIWQIMLAALEDSDT